MLCADRMVATVSSSGLVKSSSQYTCGNAWARSRFIRRARRTRPRWVSPSTRACASGRLGGGQRLTHSHESQPTEGSDTADCGPVTIRDPAETFGRVYFSLVSWLLVALIPGLLMLATFGLERLESGLRRDTVSATDVAEFLEQAEAGDVDTLARDGMSDALDCLNQRLHERESGTNGVRRAEQLAPGLPTRVYLHHLANPEFQPTRHANRV